MLDSVLVWFRRDLRDTDHAALDEALRRGRRVFCAFIFDREILDALPDRQDHRIGYILACLQELDRALRIRGGGLIVRHGHAQDEIPRLARALKVQAVFTNRDYEPAAIVRDRKVAAALSAGDIGFESFKDQAIFDGVEILSRSGRPYTVFTPYKNAWLKRLQEDDLHFFSPGKGQLVYPAKDPDASLVIDTVPRPALSAGMCNARKRLADFLGRIDNYGPCRDFPSLDATSGLSDALRFGTISPRAVVHAALQAGALSGNAGAASWLSQLIWRDFFFMILDHFPHVAKGAFKPAFDAIVWEHGQRADAHFSAWCDGKTGYPLVDAAMRQLNQTGFMHNRLRMVASSFLIKDLGINWQRGEAYFAGKLLDYDLAANNGGWQWSASTGCDAQPYFRIFNPEMQSRRFDPAGRFIRRYLPELSAVPDRFIHAPWRMSTEQQKDAGILIGKNFPAPLIAHEEARRRTLARYAAVRPAAAP